MKFSIVTPEHDPGNIPFLLELYESILVQEYENWEWILYLNGNCTIEHIPQCIRVHPQVRIYRQEEYNTNIGFIKNRAFHLATGDILVEVDHDDLITPDCLQKLHTAFVSNPDVGFVYSDDAILHMKDEFVPFDERYGWSHKRFRWRGKLLYSMNSFEPSAQAMAFIWYAPDHVRSWRASTYRDIGGHNPDLSICDDHELMIRTYLHTKMLRIPEVLYIYRITGDNTWLERNEAIQTTTIELFHRYGMQLAIRDAELRGLLCVDLGGGINPLPGFKIVDQRNNADYVCDINEGIPLPDNSVGVLNASHIIEHLHDKTKIMSEIHRVLAHGGWAFIEVPSTDGRGAFQDPTHVSYWNENSFLYYTNRYMADFIDNKNIRFQEWRRGTLYPNEWLKNLHVLITNVWLTAVKDDSIRYPHVLEI